MTAGSSTMAASCVGALTKNDIGIMAVSSSKSDADGAEFMLDAGREEHVCVPHFPPKRQHSWTAARSVMRDMSGKVISNRGTST